jgi:hypothetical protein
VEAFLKADDYRRVPRNLLLDAMVSEGLFVEFLPVEYEARWWRWIPTGTLWP